MTDIPTGELWGEQKYSDRARVPKKQFRCPSHQAAASNAHKCKMHRAHQGEHRCICGVTWGVQAGATQ